MAKVIRPLSFEKHSTMVRNWKVAKLHIVPASPSDSFCQKVYTTLVEATTIHPAQTNSAYRC